MTTPTAASAPKEDRARARRIFASLQRRYPDAHCELVFSSPHELLVATILSAQATDVSVNRATPALFARFPKPASYARATPEEIEPLIASIGLFRNKARAIHAAMSRVMEVYGGEVPRTMNDLLTLRGVARKTANVVLGNAFGIDEGIVVDTHVSRLAQRFGLSAQSDPLHIERDLMALLPRTLWTQASHLLIFHGRRVCKARGGHCAADAICRRWCSNAGEATTTASSAPRTTKAARSSADTRAKRPAPLAARRSRS